MAPKRPDADPPAPTLTAEERRAAKIAAWEEKRRRRGRHSASSPLVYDVSCCPPCGPAGGYTITNSPAPNEVEINVR